MLSISMRIHQQRLNTTIQRSIILHADLLSYAAGLTPIRFWRFALAALLGLLPISFALAHMGGEFITADKSSLVVIVLLPGLLTLLPLAIRYLTKPTSSRILNNTENRQ